MGSKKNMKFYGKFLSFPALLWKIKQVDFNFFFLIWKRFFVMLSMKIVTYNYMLLKTFRQKMTRGHEN